MPDVKNALRSLKQRCVPPSSRSFHRRTDSILKQIQALRKDVADVSNRLSAVEVAQHEQSDVMLRSMQTQLELLQRQGKAVEARAAHNRFYLEQLYRQDGEDPQQTTARLFKSLPPAEGAIRLSQLATAKLLHDLDEICKYLGIEYWLSFGALVATVYRNEAIPWDDDIDVGMLRKDATRLIDYLKEANAEGADPNEPGHGYQVTIIYDWYVKIRQVRFSLVDEDIPCFIDIFFCDLANAALPDANARLRELYELQTIELNELSVPDGVLGYWSHYPCLRAEGSAGCAQMFEYSWDAIDPAQELECTRMVQSVMDKYHQQLVEEGIVLPQDAAVTDDAPFLVYGIDNLNEVAGRPFVWDTDLFFPTQRDVLEGFEVRVPNQAKAVCDANFLRKTPFLPTDIYSHSHYAGGMMSDNKTFAAMQRYVGL